MDWLKLWNKTQIARALSPADWLTLAEAWWTLLSRRMTLNAARYERLDDSACQTERSARSESRALSEAQRLGRLIRLAARLHFLPMSCLVQSLALRTMLKRRGVFAQLQIGARKEQGRLRAHAWVEVGSTPINEAADVAVRFVPFVFANLNNRKFK